uniref:Uncharacterized protein n=1 Tax=Anguilla anguilla TaxID=7936 RepID=A0A0E9P850_ANGAN
MNADKPTFGWCDYIYICFKYTLI